MLERPNHMSVEEGVKGLDNLQFSLLTEAPLKFASIEGRDVCEPSELESPSVAGRIVFDITKMATTELSMLKNC